MASSEIQSHFEFSPKYSLSHLTLLDCSIPELVYIASRAGYDSISPRLIPMGVTGECPCQPLEREILRATRSALKTTGMAVHDIELASITSGCEAKNYEAAMEAGAELGAGALVASVWTDNREDQHYITDKFVEICDLARLYGLSVVLEFPTFSRLNNLRDTVEIVRAAARPNGGILIDTLYTHMSRVDLSELKSLPPDWFCFIQVSDVLPGIPDTQEGMLQIAREARLYPGEGCIDFSAIVERLPPVDISIELPNRSRIAELGCEEHARRCLKACKRIFENIQSKRIPSAGNARNGNLVKEESYGSRTH